MLQLKKKPANTERTYHVTHDDLPLSCPTKQMTLWNSHPRVYLPIEKEGEVICPYCGAKYILINER
ncbi:MAG: zinc-finger domain-containing protein [Gammaproteobacteria bacterium]